MTWVIEDENGSINKNPTKEQLKITIYRKNMPKICCVCKGDMTYVDKYGYSKWMICKCRNKNCTGWLCKSKIYNRLPDSVLNRNPDWRNGRLSQYCSSGKGFIAEMIVAKVRNLKNCNIEKDNFNYKFDLSIDQEYGKLQVKNSTFNEECKRWIINIDTTNNFDHLWIVCMSIDRKHVERIYIIPRSKLCNNMHIVIHEDWSGITRISKFEWIEKYRVDEKPYDKI